MIGTWSRRSRLNQLIGLWVEFRDIARAHLGDEATTQAVERRFLDLKGIIAERMARVGEGLAAAHAGEAAVTQRGMIDFMNSYPSLVNATPPTPPQCEEFDRQWQRFYLQLNQLKGLKTGPAQGPRMRAPIVEPYRMRHRFLYAVFGNWFVKFVLVVAVLSGAVYVLTTVLPWERMGLGPKVSELSAGAADAGRGLMEGARNLDGFAGRVRDFFDPVVQQWGVEATVVMCTVLLIAFGYWVFIRVR